MPSHPVLVTRKFPPSIGGMETLAAGVWRSMVEVRPDARLISHGGANRDLVWWLPLALVRLLVLIARQRVELVLTGDALMYAVASPLLRLCRIPHATMIMGLDVTYESRLYRAVVHRQLRRATQVVAISAATAERAREFGVPPDRVSVLRLGVQTPPAGPSRSEAGAALRARHGLADTDLLLLTLGRLVRRKGVEWFTSEVLPGLPAQVHYLVAGHGDQASAIVAAASAAGVADRVHLLGKVDDADREELMRGADLFVQPNIAVPGDMEGFGLVTIEAAMRGTPVVAAELEGIKDALVDGSTGLLLPPQVASAWTTRLNELVKDRQGLVTLGTGFQTNVLHLYGEAAMGRALADQLGLEVQP